MESAIDYTNLVNFAKFANGVNNNKYNNMYALRGYDYNMLYGDMGDEYNNYIEEPNDDNADKVTKKDFDVLLMILSGAIDNNTYNFGGDCDIVGEPICFFENPDADTIAKKNPRHKIEIDKKNFTKCTYGSKALNINQNTSNILNGDTLIVEPDQGDPCHINNIANHMCPDDTHFYWDTKEANWGFAGNLFNYFTDEKAKHGQCVKRYGVHPGAKIDKNSIVENDPYKDKVSDDGKCMDANIVITDSNRQLRTPLPDESTGICDEAGCEINYASENELARECANADKIYYDGGAYTIPKKNGSGVLTQDCKIFTTTPRLTRNDESLTQKASRQDIEDRENECKDSQKPYYNSELDANNIRKDSYDIPSNIIDSALENENTWWKNNTCRYVYEIPLKTETGQTYENNEIWHPPLFNGQCSISNLGSNYTLGSGSASEPNSSDSINYESIGLFVEEDILKDIKNNPSPIEHPFYSSSSFDNVVTENVYSGASRNGESLNTQDDNLAQTRCVWLGSGSGTYDIDGNETLNATPKPRSIKSTGQFFKYVKNVDRFQYTKEPNYYKNSRLDINKMIPYGKWRQVDVCDSEDENKGYGYQKQTPGELEFDETGGKWYNDANFQNLDTIYENNSNKLYKLKVNANDDIQSNSDGTGSGKCLRKITINKLPQYVRDSDDDTLKFNDTGNTANKVNETHLEYQFGVGSDSVYKIYNEIYKANLEEGNSLYYTIENKLCDVGADFTNELNNMSEFNVENTINNIQDAYVQLEHAWIKESPQTT
jgi:hypothetical protein